MKWVDVKISFSSFPLLLPLPNEHRNHVTGWRNALKPPGFTALLVCLNGLHYWIRWAPVGFFLSDIRAWVRKWIMMNWWPVCGIFLPSIRWIIEHNWEQKQLTSCKQIKRYGSGNRYMECFTLMLISSLQDTKYGKTILRGASMTSFQLKYTKFVLWDIIIEPSAYTV